MTVSTSALSKFSTTNFPRCAGEMGGVVGGGASGGVSAIGPGASMAGRGLMTSTGGGAGAGGAVTVGATGPGAGTGAGGAVTAFGRGAQPERNDRRTTTAILLVTCLFLRIGRRG